MSDGEVLLRALLAGDSRTAMELAARRTEAAGSLYPVYSDLLAPVLHEVGRLWQMAAISVADEHLATAIVQTTMARLVAGRPPAPRRGLTALVCCTEGEHHELGARMAADVLEDDGWTVHHLGASAPVADVASYALRTRPDLIALSTTRSSNLVAVAGMIASLRSAVPGAAVVVGGAAYGDNAGLARRFGATALLTDPREASGLVTQRVG